MLSCYQRLLLTNCFRQFFTLGGYHLQLLGYLLCFLNNLFVHLHQFFVLGYCLNSLFLGLVVQLFCLSLLYNFVISQLSHFLAFLLEHLDQTCLDHLLLITCLNSSLWAEVTWSWGCLQVLCVISESTRWISVVACGVQILGTRAIQWSIVEARIKCSWLGFVYARRTHCLLTCNRWQETLCWCLINTSFTATSAQYRDVLVQLPFLIGCALRSLSWLSVLLPKMTSKLDCVWTTWTQILRLTCLKLCLQSDIRLILNVGWILLFGSS